MADESLVRQAVKIVGVCACWYALSAANNVLGKEILSVFPHPVTLPMMQLTVSVCLLGPLLTLDVLPQVPPAPNLSGWFFMKSLVPLGLGKLLAKMAGYVSLGKLPVSYNHTGERVTVGAVDAASLCVCTMKRLQCVLHVSLALWPQILTMLIIVGIGRWLTQTVNSVTCMLIIKVCHGCLINYRFSFTCLKFPCQLSMPTCNSPSQGKNKRRPVYRNVAMGRGTLECRGAGKDVTVPRAGYFLGGEGLPPYALNVLCRPLDLQVSFCFTHNIKWLINDFGLSTGSDAILHCVLISRSPEGDLHTQGMCTSQAGTE